MNIEPIKINYIAADFKKGCFNLFKGLKPSPEDVEGWLYRDIKNISINRRVLSIVDKDGVLHSYKLSNGYSRQQAMLIIHNFNRIQNSFKTVGIWEDEELGKVMRKM